MIDLIFFLNYYHVFLMCIDIYWYNWLKCSLLTAETAFRATVFVTMLLLLAVRTAHVAEARGLSYLNSFAFHFRRVSATCKVRYCLSADVQTQLLKSFCCKHVHSSSSSEKIYSGWFDPNKSLIAHRFLGFGICRIITIDNRSEQYLVNRYCMIPINKVLHIDSCFILNGP